MKLIDMSDYNRTARACWFALVLLGAVVGVSEFFRCLSFTGAEWEQLLVLISLVVISSSRPISIPNTTGNITFSDTFIFLGVIFLGVPAAIVLGVVDSFISAFHTSRRATTWLGASAVMTLTTFIAANSFYATLNVYADVDLQPLGTSSSLGIKQLLVPLAVLALAQYFLNTITTAAMYAVRDKCSFWMCWRDNYLWTAWSFFAAAITSGLVFQAIQSFGLLHVLLGVPVVVATYATYKIYFAHVSESAREVAEMSRINLATVEALATAIDAKDQTSHCHVQRVQIYAAHMGKLMGLSESDIKALRAGALLHDVGKLAVPDHILNKPGELSPAEFEKMKIHTSVGAQILERVGFPYPVVPVVRHHHEQWDGTGYPEGLKGEAIPLTARILSIIDCYDTLREDRPHRLGLTREEACEMLRHGAGRQFDPRVTELFLTNLDDFDAELIAAGIGHDETAGDGCVTSRAAEAKAATGEKNTIATTGRADAPPAYLEQIKNAHHEVYALYEIASMFGSSLDVEDTATVLVSKTARVVPFDTCAVYLYDEAKGYAIAAHVSGRNADVVRGRAVGFGEGVVGFVLANRRAAGQLDPMLDFAEIELPEGDCYRSMLALPLVKGERLVGALAAYSFAPRRYTDDHMRLLDTVVHLASDALANAMRHAETESNALTDTLTGLPNARALHARFEEEAARARRTGHPFQVVMLDLDNFKRVNDTFGHKVGDQVLREAAHIIGAQLREYDFLARYAGDEFVAVVQDLSNAQVTELCERIEKAVNSFSIWVRRDERAGVGISVGAATYGVRGETLDQLLIAADNAMYAVKSEHKKRGSNAQQNFTPNHDDLASTSVN
ncbi:MAG TPA: diguanylate cyclase [Pyrinomonadaceae bacterium]|nr:diguanylate cyclase [Pyrinomonadaceae bacterium]